MRTPPLITHIPQFADVPHFEFAQILAASSVWFDTGEGKKVATFDLTVRDMPGERNFLLFSGVEEIITGMLHWKYDPGYLAYLAGRKIISKKFAAYLRHFKFAGDVHMLPEGNVFFPGEPIVRITAKMQDANLFTNFLSTCVCFPTLFFSKAVRVKLAARGKLFEVSGAMRTNGFENTLKIQRLAHLLGSATSIPYFGYKNQLPRATTGITFPHALIKSYPREIDAFRAIAALPHIHATKVVMVDTYDLKKGVQNYIQAEHEARKIGRTVGWILLDSGNLLRGARYIRTQLDRVGLADVKIGATSNLDEFRVDALERQHAPIDAYGAQTEVVTVADRPALEAVFKLAEQRDAHGHITYAAKLTPGKLSLPGRKQIFRTFRDGKMQHDTIGLEHERLGVSQLVRYIAGGKLVTPLPSLAKVHSHVERQLAQLPPRLLSVTKRATFPVRVSSRIQKILQELRQAHG